jgi:glucose-6-phosphate dehydrogenase assembly protein OpcA
LAGRQFPEVTRLELAYEKGQPSVAPMWQWTRQRLQATTLRSRSGQAARVWQQNRVFCALRTLHLRERLVETESATFGVLPAERKG